MEKMGREEGREEEARGRGPAGAGSTAALAWGRPWGRGGAKARRRSSGRSGCSGSFTGRRGNHWAVGSVDPTVQIDAGWSPDLGRWDGWLHGNGGGGGDELHEKRGGWSRVCPDLEGVALLYIERGY